MMFGYSVSDSKTLVSMGTSPTRKIRKRARTFLFITSPQNAVESTETEVLVPRVLNVPVLTSNVAMGYEVTL